MILTKKLIEQNALPDEKKKNIILTLNRVQLLSLKGISDLINPKIIVTLKLQGNYFKSIDEHFLLLQNVRELDISLNHIEKIENLQNMGELIILNLSNNKISKIENLEILIDLKYLDLSVNQIEKIENLELPKLLEVNLSGNLISEIENMETLYQLQLLILSKNKLERIDTLALIPSKQFKKLDLAYNRIISNYLDDLCIVLANLKLIEYLDLTGNEITLNKYYKLKIMKALPNLKILDNNILKKYQRNQIEGLKKVEDLEKLIRDTKEEYMERIRAENRLKKQTVELIQKQIQIIEEQYNEYENALEEDLERFLEFAAELRQKKIRGENVDLDEKTLEQWRTKLIAAENERKALLQLALENQEQIKRDYIDKKIASTKFTEKLYEISMKSPDVWRDLKVKEYEQVQKEEAQQQKRQREGLKDIEEPEETYDNIMQEMQDKMTQDLGKNIMQLNAQELQKQREQAANIIKSNLQTKIKEKNIKDQNVKQAKINQQNQKSPWNQFDLDNSDDNEEFDESQIQLQKDYDPNFPDDDVDSQFNLEDNQDNLNQIDNKSQNGDNLQDQNTNQNQNKNDDPNKPKNKNKNNDPKKDQQNEDQPNLNDEQENQNNQKEQQQQQQKKKSKCLLI